MAGITNLIQQGIKYTPKGTALIRKQLGIGIKDFVQEGFKGVQIPKDAVSYDAVKVGKNFNAEEFFSDIITFRDKNGDILKTFRNDIDGNETKQITKWFKNLCKIETEFNEDLIINSRKNSGYERVNGKITKCWDQVVSRVDDDVPVITTFKRTTSWEQEVHELKEFKKGQKSRFIENKYDLTRTDHNGEKYKPGPGYYRLVDSKTSDKNLEAIADHSYAFPYMSKYNKFIYRMFNAIDNEKDSILSPGISLYTKASRLKGYYSPHEGELYAGVVNINKIDQAGNIRPRESLTNTIAHEYGHHNWGEKADNLDFFGSDSDIIKELNLSNEEIKLLKKYKKSMNNYVESSKNYQGYYEQFSERAARVEGREASMKYDNLCQNINKEFKYIHPEQFYDISKEANDSNEIFNIMDFFGETRADLFQEKENLDFLNFFVEKIKKNRGDLS